MNQVTGDTWDALERDCLQTYAGGYHDAEKLNAFRHGMSTIFNVLRGAYLDADAMNKVINEAAELRQQVSALTAERDDCRELHRQAEQEVAKVKRERDNIASGWDKDKVLWEQDKRRMEDSYASIVQRSDEQANVWQTRCEQAERERDEARAALAIWRNAK